MADEVARLVAVLEANTKQFTKGMEDARKLADRQLGAIQKRGRDAERSLSGQLGGAANALAARFLGLGAAIRVLSRIAEEAAKTNDEVKASVERMNEAYARLGESAGPGIAFVNNRLADLLDSVNNVVTGLRRAGNEIQNSPIFGGKGGINIPIAPNPFTTTARIDPTTKNVIPAPGGFPVPGVTDVTPKKGAADTVAAREAALTIETARKVEEAIGDLIEKQSKENNEFRAKQYEEARELRNSASADELDALDQFHADATAAWDNYYEHLNEMIEDQVRLEELANETRRDNLRDTFGEISTLTRSSSNELRAIGKAAAIAQATIDGILAVQKALASAPPPFNFALAALVGAATAANVAEIAGMERGGRVSAGTPYIVGERRPELFVPDAAGTIVPRVPNIADANSGMSGMSISFNQNLSLAANGDAALADIARRGALDGANMAIRTIERRFPSMMVKAQRDRL